MDMSKETPGKVPEEVRIAHGKPGYMPPPTIKCCYSHESPL